MALELEWRLGSNELGSNILELIVILGLELGLRSSGVGVGMELELELSWSRRSRCCESHAFARPFTDLIENF